VYFLVYRIQSFLSLKTLYGCETQSLALSEEKKSFGNRALRRIIESKRKHVTRGWRKSQNENLHNLWIVLNSDCQIKEDDEMGGSCITHGKYENCV
jgi:hypothetical protein